jgi:hypothetical protein
MRINKLLIHKFRNLENCEYDLGQINIFSGKNELGKTNTIQALHWLFTNELLETGKDVTTVKDNKDLKAVIDVEIITETNTSIRKKYYENWINVRGTDELKLDGNVTEFYINNCPIPATKKTKELMKVFQCEYSSSAKINLLSALIDPLYLSEKVEYTDFRQYLIGIVGDISNETICEEKQFKAIKELLATYLYDESKMREGISEKIKSLKEEIKDLETTKYLVCPNCGYKFNDETTLKAKLKQQAEEEINLLLTDKLIAHRINLLNESIKKIFGDIEFTLFEKQIGEGYKQVCYATFKGIPFTSVNTSSRIKLGIAIIERIKAKLGLNDLPIIFDKVGEFDTNNLKSLSEMTKAQIFTTKVSDEKEIKLIKGE